MNVLFGRNPHQRDDFDREADAAEALDLESFQVDLSALLSGDAEGAVSTLPLDGRRLFLYRGWMLSAEEYEALAEAVSSLGHRLVTSPRQYITATYLPSWYPTLRQYTARSVWSESTDATPLWSEALEVLGPPPWIVKDHVKSAKEHWAEACFVPADATREQFAAIVERLVECRGERFERGVVVRRFLDLQTCGRTEAGPAFLEFRLFFVRQRLIAAESYWDFDVEVPDFSAFEPLAARIRSPFFVMDVAQLAGGGWCVIELNDGGVATLPASLDPRDLFSALATRLGTGGAGHAPRAVQRS